ncbi:MAG: cobalamin-dependent protein, partial [bacterium]
MNSVFLYHAVRAGLDLAIVHAGQVVPYPAIHRTERKLAENLLFDRDPEALNHYVDYFEKKKAKGESRTHPVVNRPPDEGLKHAIIHREREGIELLIDKALNEFPPEKILNEILLPAMQEVGKKMADGELILPFVLQSAEVMKAAVARLESHMPQLSGKSRGKILLATVAGDVHDIGKNLVKTILQNNGYEVCDLGKQVPNSTIVGKAKEIQPDIIGLSALLVTTSRQMEYCVEELQRAGLQIPVMIGGAAINRLFARRISWIGSDQIYKPGVYFANDAFAGLQITEGLLNPTERAKLEAMAEEGALTYRKNHDKSVAESKIKKETKIDAVSQVVHDHPVPEPPFWGPNIIGQVDIDEIIPLLDTKILFKLNWGIRGRTAEEYHSLVHSTFEPLLEDLLKESKRHSWLLPAVVYGYWPANSLGDEVIIYDPFDNDLEVGRFGFPRQPNGERLCVADYFRPVESGEKDIIALQVVTMGEKVSEVVRSFTQSGEYAKGFFLHGLAVEAAEALAEWLHRKIRTELEIE